MVRALALGSDMTFAGKAFLWGLGALGAEGPRPTVNDLLIEEMKSALGRIGVASPAQARAAVVRHVERFGLRAADKPAAGDGLRATPSGTLLTAGFLAISRTVDTG